MIAFDAPDVGHQDVFDAPLPHPRVQRQLGECVAAGHEKMFARACAQHNSSGVPL